jgi:hypothetical protein
VVQHVVVLILADQWHVKHTIKIMFSSKWMKTQIFLGTYPEDTFLCRTCGREHTIEIMFSSKWTKIVLAQLVLSSMFQFKKMMVKIL